MGSRLQDIAYKDTLTLNDRAYLSEHCEEVIYCTECKYHGTINCAMQYDNLKFCSKGKRKGGIAT